MDDSRLPFVDAKREFVSFLRAQGWPTDLLWLSRQRVTGRRHTYWVLRPEELTSDTASATFYEAARRTSTNLRIDALGRLDGQTIAYVEDYGGERHMLNFGVPDEPLAVRRVDSSLVWAVLRTFTRLAGESPLLRTRRITGAPPPGETL